MYAHVVDGEVRQVEDRLPRGWRLESGRSVSGFHNLPAAEVEAEGWFKVHDEGPPEYNRRTHRSDLEVVLVDDVPTAQYTVVKRDDVPASLVPDGHHDPVIGAPGA